MSWSIHDLLPICPVPTCPKYGTRHLLTHQSEILTTIIQSDINYFYWQGGVGSAKTRAVAAFAAAMAIMVPNSKGILFRISYKLNYETLWGYFTEAIVAAIDQKIIPGTYKEIFSVKYKGSPTVCKLRNGAEFQAAITPEWRKVLGPNYDVIIISDAMENENFKEIFQGEGTVGGLKSRLRGAASSFFKMPDGQFRDMRKFIVESNPPPEICDIHEIFGREPGIRSFDEDEIKYQYFESNTLQNDHNPPNYVAEVSAGHDVEDLQRILGGKTIPYYGGKKVIPEFNEEYHVNEFEVDEDLPLLVSIDPGLQHPGVLFSQIKRCEYDREHYIRLSEISNLYDLTTYQLASLRDGHKLGILAHLGLFYPTFFNLKEYLEQRKLLLKDNEDETELIQGGYEYLEPYFNRILFCIDKSAKNRSATTKDKTDHRTILLKHYGIRCTYRTGLDLDQSIMRVRKGFEILCVCNIPQQLVSRNCRMLIDGYKGGYRYFKNKDGTHKDKPLEDHKYEDICDADRYGLENFLFKGGYAGKEMEDLPRVVDRYSWMTTGYSIPSGDYSKVDK